MKAIRAITFAGLMTAGFSAYAVQPIINLNVGGELAPGVYGEVQFGNAPPPPVVYAQPRVIYRHPDEDMAPLYLHVPPGHARNWRKHCREYDACDRPVYFVRSREYDPGYMDEERRGRGRGHDRHHGHDESGYSNDEHGVQGDRRGGEHGDHGRHEHDD